MRVNKPIVIRAAPIQSTAAILDLRRPSAADIVGGTGMKSMPATEMIPAMMARAPKTHFQLAHSTIRPEMILPKTLPRGAPAAM